MLYLLIFFHLLNQQSDALNSLIPNVFANSKPFYLSMILSIGIFWLLFPTNQQKTALSIWPQLPQRVFFREDDIPFFSKEVVNLRLFFTNVERVYFGYYTLLPRPYLSFPFPSLLKLYILHLQAYCLTFVLWAPFFSRKKPRMVCLNSRRFLFSNIECMIRKRLNVRILWKKFKFY